MPITETTAIRIDRGTHKKLGILANAYQTPKADVVRMLVKREFDTLLKEAADLIGCNAFYNTLEGFVTKTDIKTQEDYDRAIGATVIVAVKAAAQKLNAKSSHDPMVLEAAIEVINSYDWKDEQYKADVIDVINYEIQQRDKGNESG